MLPADGRRQNLSLVLQALYTGGPMSRADLARRLQLTKVTVSDLVGALLERGQLLELGPSEVVRPGKPATLVDVNRTGLQVIGVDLTAHEALRAAVLDLDGNVLDRCERPLTGSSTGEDVLADVLALVADAVSRATAPLLGIGVGTPGVVGPDGDVLTAPNLGWSDVALRSLLAAATGLPVLVCNDADAAVHAEYTLGDGGDDMILVKIGLGVGCGLIVAGQRVRGAHSAAGEIGHVTVGTDGGEVCGCGNTGCLETWLSAPRLQKALADSAPDADRGAARRRRAPRHRAGAGRGRARPLRGRAERPPRACRRPAARGRRRDPPSADAGTQRVLARGPHGSRLRRHRPARSGRPGPLDQWGVA